MTYKVHKLHTDFNSIKATTTTATANRDPATAAIAGQAGESPVGFFVSSSSSSSSSGANVDIPVGSDRVTGLLPP